MNADLFYNTIQSYGKFPDEDIAFFLSLFTERKFKKNAILLHAGEVAHEVFFITKGATRQCFDTEEGAEKTCNFTFEGEFITDLESFSRQSRSSTSIITLEPTDALSIRCTELVAVLQQSPSIAGFFRLVVEKVAADNIRRTKSLLSMSPDKQFEELIVNKPDILQRVPQRYIAQYLGVAPESLSRIRKRMMETAKS